jgi:hypothetical protein
MPSGAFRFRVDTVPSSATFDASSPIESAARARRFDWDGPHPRPEGFCRSRFRTPIAVDMWRHERVLLFAVLQCLSHTLHSVVPAAIQVTTHNIHQILCESTSRRHWPRICCVRCFQRRTMSFFSISMPNGVASVKCSVRPTINWPIRSVATLLSVTNE